MTTHQTAGDSTVTARIEVGSGAHQYLRLREWGVPPVGTEFGKISAVAVDSQDRVYVYQRDIAEQGIHPMVVLDREGVAIDSWGRGDITDAHGLHITRSDELLAVDRDGHRVVKFTLAGDIVMVLGGQPAWQAPFNHPTDVAVGPTGDIYVTDGYCNSSVHHFSAAGEFVESWGRPGDGNGEFRVPHGIWVDEERIYVADRDNNRVQLLSLSGEFVEAWTDFYRPTDVFIDRTGHIFVTELIPRVNVFEPSGRLVARLRPANNNAHGVWADSRGDLYVAPTDGRGVEKFVRTRSAATDGA